MAYHHVPRTSIRQHNASRRAHNMSVIELLSIASSKTNSIAVGLMWLFIYQGPKNIQHPTGKNPYCGNALLSDLWLCRYSSMLRWRVFLRRRPLTSQWHHNDVAFCNLALIKIVWYYYKTCISNFRLLTCVGHILYCLLFLLAENVHICLSAELASVCGTARIITPRLPGKYRQLAPP